MNEFDLPTEVTALPHGPDDGCACCDRAGEVVAVFESDRGNLHHLMFEAVAERDDLRGLLGEAKAALELCLGESHLCADHNPSCRVCVQRAALARIREESAEASATPLELAVAGLVPAHALPPLAPDLRALVEEAARQAWWAGAAAEGTAETVYGPDACASDVARIADALLGGKEADDG